MEQASDEAALLERLRQAGASGEEIAIDLDGLTAVELPVDLATAIVFLDGTDLVLIGADGTVHRLDGFAPASDSGALESVLFPNGIALAPPDLLDRAQDIEALADALNTLDTAGGTATSAATGVSARFEDLTVDPLRAGPEATGAIDPAAAGRTRPEPFDVARGAPAGASNRRDGAAPEGDGAASGPAPAASSDARPVGPDDEPDSAPRFGAAPPEDGPAPPLGEALFTNGGDSVILPRDLDGYGADGRYEARGGDDVVRGGSADDRIDGGSGRDRLFGEKGDDVLFGGDGNDTLDGGKGDDTLIGGRGDDVLTGGAGNDVFVWNAGDGRDRYRGGAGNDTLRTDAEAITLRDGFSADGVERLEGAGDTVIQGANAGESLDLRGMTLSGVERIDARGGDDTVRASHGADTVDGGSGRDRLFGEKGDDVLFGGDGNDTLDGGKGQDTLIGGRGADRLTGGAGNDTASYAESNQGVRIHLASGEVSGGDAEGDRLSGIENLIASRHGDRLSGDNRANRLDGGAGSDTLTGAGGNDVFVLGTDGVDTVTDFTVGADRLDVASVVDVGGVDAIDNYLRVIEDGAGNAVVQVDQSGSGERFSDAMVLQGVTGVTLDDLTRADPPAEG